MTPRAITCGAAVALLALGGHPRAEQRAVLGVDDAIGMVRIQPTASIDRRVAAISPDGTKIGAVVWRGDLERNVNVYSLIVLDLTEATRTGKTTTRSLISMDFAGDPLDQLASPISAVSFSADAKRVTFIGRNVNAPAQVYQADIQTGALTQLTVSGDPVRSYATSPDGTLRMFSVAAKNPSDSERLRQLEDDGVFVFGQSSLLPRWRRFLTGMQAVSASQQREIRLYFWLPDGSFSDPRLIFDSRQSHDFTRADPDPTGPPTTTLDDERTLRSLSTMTADPTGRSVLMYPYAVATHEMRPERYDFFKEANEYTRRAAQPYGLIDLRTGAIERLIDAPHSPLPYGGSLPVWAPDGRSVIIHSLLPLNSDRDAQQDERKRVPAQWIEVDLASRQVKRLGLGREWRVLGWKDPGVTLLVSGDSRIGALSRRHDGTWGAVTDVRSLPSANAVAPSLFRETADGRHIVTIEQSLTEPPEIAAFSLSSGTVVARTNLNPQLRNRLYAPVEEIRWVGNSGLQSSGFLLKPLQYVPGRRYPLVVLLDDHVLGPVGKPFLLDGTIQLSGHALQMLAAEGFMVLYTRQPAVPLETKAESEGMREHVESAIAHLDRLGLIDVARVGLSGWSRAGYYTDYVLIHSTARFAAATRIDGGSYEYNDRMRPLRDDELNRIRTPLLIQVHGPAGLAGHAPAADRLDAFGKPVELLYFAGAPHSTVRPRHRHRSLTAHIDWWKFWLQNREDPSPEKRDQYARWRALRDRQTTN